MEIEKLNIVAIYPTSTLEKVNYIKINEPSTVKYLETNAEDFVLYLIFQIIINIPYTL